MKLIIGNQNYSSWSLRAWLFLTANKIPFEVIRVPLDTPDTRQELARYSDTCKVPVLHDGTLVIWDSLAICEYVSEKYLDKGGWPAEIDHRAVARACVAEMHSGFFALRAKMPMDCRNLGKKVDRDTALDSDIARIEQLWCQIRNRHGHSGPWLFGSFGIPDCMFAPVAFRFQSYGVQLAGAAAEYCQTLLDHTSMQLWLSQAKAEKEVLEV